MKKQFKFKETEYLFYIPIYALKNEMISYEAAIVFASLLKFEKPLLSSKLQYNRIRCYMRGNPSDDIIRDCLIELENEAYITHKIVKITDKTKKDGHKLRGVIEICTDLKDRFKHLRPRI